MSSPFPRPSRSLGAPFDIRPGEGSPLLLLFLQAFFLGLAYVYFETPVNTLYLTHFGPRDLPLVYGLTATVSVVAGLLYTRLERHLPAPRLFRWTSASLALSVAAFALAWRLAALSWLPLGMMAWKEVFWLLANLVLWSVAGLVFDSRQSKRLFGVISTGLVLASILGGLSVPLVIRHLGTEGLFLASCLAQLAWLALLTRLLTHHLGDLALPSVEEEPSRRAESFSALCADPYVALLFLAGVASFAGYYLVDFLFFHQVDRSYREEAQLAAFFGEFYAALGCVNLFTSAFVTAPLLTRFGLGTGLLLLPLVLAGGSLVALTGNGRLFAAALTMKLLDEVLRNSLERSTLRVLLQPLPLLRRLRVQAWRESLVQPASVGVSALLLLGLTRYLPDPTPALLGVLLVVSLLWVALSRELRSRYTRRLTRALERRSLPLEELDFDNSALVDLLDESLKGDQAADIIYSLVLLERMQVPTLPLLLEEALAHPREEVRAHALGRIAALAPGELAEPLVDRLQREESPALRGRMLPALCLLRPVDGVELATPFLEAEESEVRRGALVGLLGNGGIDGVLVAGGHLQQLAASPEPGERVFAAEVLGEVAQPRFFRPLLPLLEDPEREVRRAALTASGRLANPHLVPYMVRHLDAPGLGDAASLALIRVGEPALPALEEALETARPESPLYRRVLGVLGHLPLPRARELLRTTLGNPSPGPRHRALRALVEGGGRLGDASELQELLEQELRESAWNQAAQAGLEDSPELGTLRGALVAEARRRRERVVLILALHYPRNLVMKLVPRVLGPSTSQRAYALEVLDDLLSPTHRSLCFPLLDDLTPGDRLRRLPGVEVPAPRSSLAWIHALLAPETPGLETWTRAAALEASRHLAGESLVPSLRPYLEAPPPLLRETALAALAHLAPELAREAATRARHDPAPEVARTARGILQGT